MPQSFFNSLFLTGHGGALQVLENVLVGPLVAVLSFVCSVGNVPLAAVLWGGGISFAGVIAFIYADLIIIPLVIVYRRYYGWRVAGIVVGLMFGSMVVAALAVDGIFSALGLVPSTRPSIDSITERGVEWNYTAVLNIVFTLVAVGPVRAHAAARRARPGLRDDGRPRHGALRRARRARYFFCGPGCRASFAASEAPGPEATR